VIKQQGSEPWIACDGCGRSCLFVLARNGAAARKSARQEGWSTARGRDLCASCKRA
jgi:hypothetical protein